MCDQEAEKSEQRERADAMRAIAVGDRAPAARRDRLGARVRAAVACIRPRTGVTGAALG